MKIRMGLFEDPYPVSSNKELILSKKHLESAKQAAIESAVLLQNKESLLPLSKDIKSVAVIGPMAEAPHEQLGTWSFDGKKADSVTPLKALKSNLPEDVKVNYASGLKISRTMDQSGFKQAIEAAEKSDVSLTTTSNWGGLLALFGNLLFSGSLYGIVLTGVKKLGAITPIGGLFYIAAWGCVGFGV